MISKPDHAEQYREDDEAGHLYGFPADRIDKGNRHPISWDVACNSQNEIANGRIVEVVVDIARLGVPNRGKNGRVVQAQAPECNVNEEPGSSGSEQNLSVLPLPEMREELGPSRLGRCFFSASLRDIGMAFISCALSLTTKIRTGICLRLFHVQGDICCIPRCFWDSQAEVHS